IHGLGGGLALEQADAAAALEVNGGNDFKVHAALASPQIHSALASRLRPSARTATPSSRRCVSARTSRAPVPHEGGEILEEAKAPALALLRMELRRGEGALAGRGRERA